MSLTVKKRRFLQDGYLELKLSDGRKLKLDPVGWNLNELEEGCELSNECFAALDNQSELLECRYKAESLLLNRLHTTYELRQKLFKKGDYRKEFIFQVLDELETSGFLNDENFATLYATELIGRGYGKRAISQRFYKKGLRGESIKLILDEICSENSEVESALLRLAEKKLKSLSRESDEYKKRQKLFRYLAGRGFDSSEINKVLQQVLK